MLDLINLYAHGFVAVPVIISCKQKGFFRALQQKASLTLEQMVDLFNANSGHLQVALRLMQSLNWLSQNHINSYSLTEEGKIYNSIPEDILDLYHIPIDSYLLGKQKSGLLKVWIERSRQRWDVDNAYIANFLDGVLIVPILLGLQKNNLLQEDEQKHLFSELDSSVREELCEFFVNKQWGNIKGDSFVLTDAGKYILDRALLFGTVASYTPMLSHMDDLLFGDCQAVFTRHIAGDENHVDRTLNVIASGFQHQKYFAEVDEMILAIFNRLPFAEQPKYVADMGCGDGTLLKRVYDTIRGKSARGKVLDQYPLKMIGIDYNQASLTETANTLADLPHLVIQGDIGDPEQLVVDLQEHEIHDFENILHIRSFLDHDRPFIPPQELDQVTTRSHIPYQGVSVNAKGNLIPSSIMIQSLVEHLNRWSKIITKHGLIILEVHSLKPEVVYEFLDQSENLHFDAYHAFSMQHLIEADVFMMAAAEVGLFPKFEFSKKYPQIFPFSRITLNCFEKQGYKIRHPNLSDLADLINLEAKCWPEHLQASAAEIKRRLELFPDGHCLLEIDGKVVGIVYSQKISSIKVLETATYHNISSLHTDDGAIVQLLGLNILPEMHNQGLGDRLREFMLRWCALKGGIKGVVGVTRCKNYGNHSQMPMAEYILQRNKQGQLLEPILCFHEQGGAEIKTIIPNYRPEDVDNFGMGILIAYNIHNLTTSNSNSGIKVEQKPQQKQSSYQSDFDTIIHDSIRNVIGEQRMKGFAWKCPLMEIGLDSLELLELKALLGEHFGVKLEPTFFFQYGTPERISRYFFNLTTSNSNLGIKVEQKPQQSQSSYQSDFNTIIHDSIRTVIGEQRMKGFAWKCPLMEIGLDSLELLELKALLGEHFGVKLEPTFFFQYGTPERISRYFQHGVTVAEKDVKPSSFPLFPPLIPDEDEPEIAEESDTNAPQVNSSQEEEIAIIGMACRFPGSANSPEEYWSLLRDGIDGITEVPQTRWDIEQYYDAQQLQTNKISSKYGGFIDRVDQFDPQFFRISPREATYTDPQQRILLEESWKALENAGIDPESLAGTQTGVFVGIFGHDYELLQVKQNQEVELEGYFGTGNSASIAAGRLSYFFGFTGPAIAVDTACSSSLVALHLACQSLHNGESDLALASGVNLLLSPELSITFSQSGMLSPDGRCKTFDASANGYIRSEGCGVVVLKRLSDAIADNDKILAVVKGTAINQDGASNGLTAPNKPAQEAVIQKALSVAGVLPHEVDYVEAHGTATSLGDPVEITALEAVYGQGKTRENPLIIGSVKTNIGHTEAAAGIAGLIKVVLAMQHQYIPPHLHFQELNPYIHLDQIPAEIPQQGREWKANRPIAGVSSFGFSGTNAHVILEQAPCSVSRDQGSKSRHHLLTLSAKTPQALDELVNRYQDYLETNGELKIGDICYTAQRGRTHFNHRLAIIASNQQELAEKLSQYQAGEEALGIFSGESTSRANSRKKDIVFLFTGQGSQYINMGRQLYQTQPVFRQAIAQCDTILRNELEKPLLSVLYPNLGNRGEATVNGEETLLDQTAYTQPALFAIEYALFKLWQSWGIEPAVVIGHSVGEYVAATVAGVFSLEDGLKLIAHRGRLMQQLPSGGGMVAVMVSEEQANQLIAPYAEKVTIAAINGPQSVVISGEGKAIEMLINSLEAEGIKNKQLQVSHAFHSSLMKPMLESFEAVANQINYHQPQIPLMSNVTGKMADENITTASYWVNHVCQPVKFAQSMATLDQEGYKVFLEIGPKPILLGMGRQCVEENQEHQGVWLPSLRPGLDDWQQLLESVAQLYVREVAIDWSNFNQNYQNYQKVTLPNYPFQRQRYWLETAQVQNHNQSSLHLGNGAKTFHPLLNQRLPLAGSEEVRFHSQISSNQPAYLTHHRIYQTPIVPASAYLEMVLAAGSEIFQSDHLRIESFLIQQALILPDDEVKTVQLVWTPQGSKAAAFQIFSLNNADWTLHASGEILVDNQDRKSPQINLSAIQDQFLKQICVRDYYQELQQQGIAYGSSFQGIARLWQQERAALGEITLPEELILEAKDYKFHPVLLDACFQVLGTLFADDNQQDIYLQVGLERLQVYRLPDTRLWSYVQVQPVPDTKQQHLTATVQLLAADGQIVAEMAGLQLKRASRTALLGIPQDDHRNYLPHPSTIQEQLLPQLSAFIDQPILDEYKQLSPQLDALSIAYIVQALSAMNWQFQLGKTFSTSQLAEQLGIVVSQNKQILGNLLKILAEVDILSFNGFQWSVTKVPDSTDPEEQRRDLLKQYPAAAAELTLLGRCGSQLARVLQEQADPIELLFPEGDLSTATEFYTNSPLAKVMNSLVQKTILSAIKQLPPGRKIRVLEIGAGTGGTTSYLLSQLREQQTEYVFTDLSSFFLHQAQEKFRDYPFVQYQILDIEQDLGAQGFSPHQYDLIVAANVLHATADLANTLEQVKKLLVPEGLLIMSEVTNPGYWVDLTFGLTEGWWKFTDRDWRSDSPLLTPEKWQNLFQEMGWSESVTLSCLDKQAVIITQAPSIEPEEMAKTWLANQKTMTEQAVNSQIEGDRTLSLAAPEFWQQLESANSTDRLHLLVDHVCDQVTKVLRFNSSESIELERGFFELGMDSLTSLELRRHLQTSLNCELPSTFVFKYPTIQDLVDYLVQSVLPFEFAEDNDQQVKNREPQPDDDLGELEQLSESAAEALLMSKLNSLKY